MQRAALLLVTGVLCASGLACGAEPELEFADWVLPVADATPIREYAPVPRGERAENAFELIEDLVIGGDPNDPNTGFYRPTDVLAAANGNIFVVDSGNARVQMFDADGAFRRTLGQRGQGPGEFQRPSAAAMAGDRLVVMDMQNSRLSVWSDEGDHIADHATPLGFQASSMEGLSSGGLIILGPQINIGAMQAGSAPTITTVLASYSTSGEEGVRFFESESPPMGNPAEMVSDTRRRIQYMIDMGEAPRPSFALGGNDRVYVSLSAEYQVAAMNSSGEQVWALRVAWPRPRLLESSKERRVRLLARDEPDISADEFDWPEFSAAISTRLLADGQGRLYVFPILRGLEGVGDEPEDSGDAAGTENEQAADSEQAADGEQEGPRGVAVDIYSPEGELLVAGLAEGTWRSARGEYVYTISRDPDTEEMIVYRYRLVVNR